MNILQEILDWSEVWALLIPLAVLLLKPKQPRYLTPVIIYLVLALVIDLFIDLAWKYKRFMPEWMYPNNYFYNIHSIIRFICFSLFFSLLHLSFIKKFGKLIPILSILFIIINFTFFENFFRADSFSSRLLATESGLLLFYCLQYYLYKLQDETTSLKRTADFWVVTGLSIYVVFNFFYFLLYTTLIDNGYADFVEQMWNYHNLTFIILCIFIARAFYVARNN
jgi:hypothetical protein